MRTFVLLMLLLSFASLSACTTLGSEDMATRDSLDYGPEETIRLCVLSDETLDGAEATALITAIRNEMKPFGLAIEIPWTKPWKREGFDYLEILKSVVKAHPLTPPCDRIAAFVGRNAGDILWGAMLMPEVLGAVETLTRTRGFMVAQFGSVNQVFLSPRDVAAHEFFHMLGCNHGLSMRDCYKQIRQLKGEIQSLRARGIPMTPGILSDGTYVAQREAIDSLLNQATWK